MERVFLVTGIRRIIMIGKEEYPEPSTVFSRSVPCNELIFHFSGVDTVYFGDEVFKTEKNTVRFLPKGETTRYEVVRHESGECIDIFFDTDRPISEGAFVRSPAQAERLSSLFKRIFSCWVARGEGYYFECISILYQILAELQKQSYIPERQFSLIHPAVDAIHEGFLRERLRVSSLAALCGISESYLKQLFHKRFGMSPKRYIAQLRINHACELLRTERYTVTQASELCGFSDVYFFSRQFKEYMGISPMQFIKKYRSSK